MAPILPTPTTPVTPNNAAQPANPARPSWPIFLLYLLLAIPMSWPIAGQLGQAIPGVLGDAYVHLWVFSWLRDALLSGGDLFYTTDLFFPTGVSLLNHNIAWVNFFIWLPLQAIFSDGAAYSLGILLIYALNGWATYRYAVTKLTAVPAFIVGLIVAYWPYNLSHADHPNLILIAWAPLALLAFDHLLAHRRWRDSLLLGLWLALLGLTRWQLLVMSAVLLALYLLWQLATRWHDVVAVWRQLLATGLLALGLMAPFLVPVATYQASRPYPEDVFVDENLYPSDLPAYVTPGRYHPLWGDAVLPSYRRFAGPSLYVRFIGFTTLLLAVVGVAARWRQSRFWLLATAVYLLLALGSALTIYGAELFPLPYRLIEEWFIVRILRFPDRFNVLLALPVAFLAGWGVDAVRRWRNGRFAAPAPAFITLLILFEYVSVLPMLPLAAPAWYATLNAKDEPVAVLDLPSLTEEFYNKQYMGYQLSHGQPLVVGRVARPPREAYAFWEAVPLLAAVRAQNLPPSDMVNVSYQLRQLANADVDYIVLHKQFFDDAALAAWQRWLSMPPSFDSPALRVYPTEPELSSIEPQRTLLPDGNGRARLQLLTVRDLPDTRTQGEWLHFSAVWLGQDSFGRDYDACLTLSGPETVLSCQPLTPGWATSQWRPPALVRARYSWQMPPFLTPGDYALSLQVHVAGEAVDTAVTLGQLTIQPLPRSYDAPASGNPLTVTWSEGIRLHGYDLRADEANLALTLHWQAANRLDTSYKFFVHLQEPGSGALVAQTDYVPRDWTYPTTFWDAGEFVSDTITLPLDGVPPGRYRLLIGLYHPDSGVRLLPVDTAHDTGAVQLTEWQR